MQKRDNSQKNDRSTCSMSYFIVIDHCRCITFILQPHNLITSIPESGQSFNDKNDELCHKIFRSLLGL